MKEYQVLARRYRPQNFHEVIGQEAIVTTLKNAIIHDRIAHAYLFCGPRGTGKTTLARLFAKALNCSAPNKNNEPCNVCSSCKEITSGQSLDVLEVDGASNRGIEEIRHIKETVGYSSSTGSYRIYIIDEVHMLTKEAFNALLKTLEEPPPKVKFLFATTEPHKVLPTILSRCQRFDLQRISDEKIVSKLRSIATAIEVIVSDEALKMIAARAAGGLRDAESIFDQIISFHEGNIEADTVAAILGVMPRESFFKLDQAGKEGQLQIAFEIVEQLFTQGKDLGHFVESLIEHFRDILVCKLSGSHTSSLGNLSEKERSALDVSAKLYNREQCLSILDLILEAQQQIKFANNPRIALEALLLRILRSHQRIPIDYLVRRLIELENVFQSQALPPTTSIKATATTTPVQVAPLSQTKSTHTSKSLIAPPPLKSLETPPPLALKDNQIEEDPIPKASEIPPSPKKAKLPTVATKVTPLPPTVNTMERIKEQSFCDTVIQFAAVELEGSLEKHSNINI